MLATKLFFRLAALVSSRFDSAPAGIAGIDICDAVSSPLAGGVGSGAGMLPAGIALNVPNDLWVVNMGLGQIAKWPLKAFQDLLEHSTASSLSIS